MIADDDLLDYFTDLIGTAGATADTRIFNPEPA